MLNDEVCDPMILSGLTSSVDRMILTGAISLKKHMTLGYTQHL